MLINKKPRFFGGAFFYFISKYLFSIRAISLEIGNISILAYCSTCSAVLASIVIVMRTAFSSSFNIFLPIVTPYFIATWHSWNISKPAMFLSPALIALRTAVSFNWIYCKGTLDKSVRRKAQTLRTTEFAED